MEINNHKPYSRCSISIQDGGDLVVNILVFDLRVQLQHCTYQRYTLLFALIKVSTIICKREISGLSSPLRLRLRTYAQYASMNEFTCSEHSVRIRRSKKRSTRNQPLVTQTKATKLILNLNFVVVCLDHLPGLISFLALFEFKQTWQN